MGLFGGESDGEKLFKACKAGDAARVRELLRQPGVDVNWKNWAGMTGYISACSAGFVDIVRLLLDDGRVNVDARNNYEWSGLDVARMRGKQDVVRLIEERYTPGGGLAAGLLFGSKPLTPVDAGARAREEAARQAEQARLAEEQRNRVEEERRLKEEQARRDAAAGAAREAEARRAQLAAEERRRREEQLRQEAIRRQQEEADAKRARELELRLKELEVREREAALQARANEAMWPRPQREPSWNASDATRIPSQHSGNTGSNASTVAGSPRSDHGAFLSKLRITRDEVTYSPDSLLGEGSFGKVYRGVLRGATPVAVKTIKGDVTPRMVKMFLDEIAVWDGLTQRNILPLLAFCESPPLMISELVDGSMRDVLDDHRWDQVLGLKCLRGVAAGMAYLHSFKILHGDLKCDNIMMDAGVPKIADFGLAKVRTHLSLGSTSLGAEAGGGGGTPAFAAPELWRGAKLRAPMDVYAFAMVCYEVTDEGGIPFMGLSLGMLKEAVINGDRPERPDAASDGMWSLMQRMWAQSPGDRPTFVEIGREMDAWRR
ncbi:kinase-like domain-containing protein [Hyaloraphidium curvatum]|nr:kinase-like domain-containing protein [Hyaloraphidium curvatum]